MLATLLLSIGSGVIAWVLVTFAAFWLWNDEPFPPPYGRMPRSDVLFTLRLPLVLCAMVFVPILVELVTA